MSDNTKVKHPNQEVYLAGDVVRFRQNHIVRYLLDAGNTDLSRLAAILNKLAGMPFSDEDRAQFAQLIGYSVGGFRDLSYVSEEKGEEVQKLADELLARMDDMGNDAELLALRDDHIRIMEEMLALEARIEDAIASRGRK